MTARNGSHELAVRLNWQFTMTGPCYDSSTICDGSRAVQINCALIVVANLNEVM